MKTTLELPDHLVREIELRAAHEGRVVNDVVAELLAAALPPAAGGSPLEERVVSRNLPLIKVRPTQPADAGNRTTQEWCAWIKDLDLQLEVERYEKAFGHQHVDRAGG
jgi:plasmid stability protein